LKAVNLLKSTVPDIHVVLCGSEKNYLKCIKRYISENELENNVTILGFVSNEKILYLYRHAVALIMPTYFGPTNIPPLEAMALGCPVAVSNKYAMPEQVGNAGLTFNPDSPDEIADCIQRLWTDEELRQILIERGYKRVKKWGKREFEQKLLDILDTLD
jgi:glycosyltransferase involved in cell wall biosynthesis